ncbi:Mth938-like domain-containing protein [Comamonas composti]|uniref:Mth938-like domain-containing protein n=1 Tax=Comamonas composti TaxID=408558 RepID=UPI0004125B4A|nr:Mth938-like domain-containing protein [Comamonas composti]
MKLHADKSDTQTITGYGTGWLAVDRKQYEHSLIVGAGGLLQPWDCQRFEDLTLAHFEALAQLDAEVIIFGSGARNRFPPAAWLRPLMEKRLGLEAMDTQAACRTYNILANEGRNVIAALLLE